MKQTMLSAINAEKIETILESYTDQTCYGIDSLLSQWASAKSDLFQFFGNKLTIEREFSESLEDGECLTLLHNLYGELFNLNIIGTDYRGEFFRIIHTITAEELKNNKCIESRDFISTYKAGMKLSKFLRNQVLDILNFTIMNGKQKSSRELFDIKWSMFNQSLTFNGIMVISIDPLDILTMSINKYDWESCHNLKDGCHKAGPLSYMLDNHSAIAFVLKDKTEYEYKGFSHTSKKWRQMVYINLDTLISLHCRQYASDNENAAKVSRQLMADQFASYFNISNDYSVSRDLDKARQLVEDCESNNNHGDSHYSHMHYNDVLLTNNSISRVKMKNIQKDIYDSQYIMTIGNNVICPVCGDHEITQSNELQCDYCLGGTYTCSHCGERANEDNLHNGQHYCDDCHSNLFSWCEICEEYEYNDNGQYVESDGKWVCDECLRRNYTHCENCGEWISDNDLIRTNREDYCQSCHDEILHIVNTVKSIIHMKTPRTTMAKQCAYLAMMKSLKQKKMKNQKRRKLHDISFTTQKNHIFITPRKNLSYLFPKIQKPVACQGTYNV